MRVLRGIFCASILFATVTLWSQTNTNGQADESTSTDGSARMSTPPPVSGDVYPMAYSSETRANYLDGGVAFSAAYSDNVLGGVSANPVSDMSYSLWPSLALDVTRSRTHALLSYSPGFTFYQKTDARNEADQNILLDIEYRLSPHTTFKIADSYRRSNNILNQSGFQTPPISGSVQGPQETWIAPVAEQSHNSGNLQFTFQFAPNAMVGVSGSVSDLYYPNPAQAPGLYNSSTRGGSAFYSHRFSRIHYLGATYQYEWLRAFPTGFSAETRTQSLLAFYTAYVQPNLSISFFGGPQRAITEMSLTPTMGSWSPALGASLSWQGVRSSLAASCSRAISSGSGLIGAVNQDSAALSARRNLTRFLSAGLSGSYSSSRVLASLPTFSTGGHSWSGTASLQRLIGEHLNFSMGYTRLHQSYADIAALSGVTDTNREWISIAYQFTRPIGR